MTISNEAIEAAWAESKRRDRSRTSISREEIARMLEAAITQLTGRTVATTEELDSLRRFTVIRSAEGVVYEKQTMWHEAGSRDLVWSSAIALPVVVLQEGWGEE